MVKLFGKKKLVILEHVPTPTKHLTSRGHKLVDSPGNTIRLTVENYHKWYSLYLLFPDGTITEAHNSRIDYDWDGWLDHYVTPEAFIRTAETYLFEVTQETFNIVCEMFETCTDDPHSITNLIPEKWDYTGSLYLIRNDFKIYDGEFYDGDILQVTLDGKDLVVRYPFTDSSCYIDKDTLLLNCEHIIGTNY